MDAIGYHKIRRPLPHARLRRRPYTTRVYPLTFLGTIIFASVVLALIVAAAATGLYVLELTPSRYIAAYLPQPLQGLFSRPHVELPTPAATLPPHQLASLLTPLATPGAEAEAGAPDAAARPLEYPQGTPYPLIPVSLRLTPTPREQALAPTPTLTPAFAPGPRQVARSTPASTSDMNVLLTGFRHEYQGWNNCGPATLATTLSYFGWGGTQYTAAAFLKPDPEDRNVSPEQMAAFAQAQGYPAVVRVGGTLDMLKAMLHAQLPVLVERGFEPDDHLGWMGHYQLVVGYSEARQEFVVMDSYMGPMQAVPFAEFDRYWRHFNRLYIVIVGPGQSLGGFGDLGVMHEYAMGIAQAEVAANPQDAFGWFNVGANYEAVGMHTEAAAAFDRARQLGLPWRMTWYQFGWFEAYLAAERYDDVLALAEATLKPNPYSEEMYYYTGRVYAARGDTQAAREQYRLALERNPNFTAAQQALQALP